MSDEGAKPSPSSTAASGRARARSRAWVWVGAAVVVAGAVAVAAWAQLAHRGPQLYGFKVVAAYPHDPMAYTQGLVIDHGRLYEGTGRYGM